MARFVIADWQHSRLKELHREQIAEQLARATFESAAEWQHLLAEPQSGSTQTQLFCVLDANRSLNPFSRKFSPKIIAALVVQSTGPSQKLANIIVLPFESAPATRVFSKSTAYGGRSPREELGLRAVRWAKQQGCKRITCSGLGREKEKNEFPL